MCDIINVGCDVCPFWSDEYEVCVEHLFGPDQKKTKIINYCNDLNISPEAIA